MHISSPITGGNSLQLERKIPATYIIDSYLKSYGIDVSRLFVDRTEVEVYRCQESSLRFFGPEQLAGDSDFYAALQKFPWYYMDWKWEHQVVSEMLAPGSSVLEIGCAEGAFLERLDSGIETIGLELNKTAALAAQENGVDVRTETIQEHADCYPEQYDVVCSFQVMEHVSDVKGIVEASVKTLKKGGRLIISVPNNDSFIRHSPNSILNMPPHHMCLWDEQSLGALATYFDIELDCFKKEPLQPYHYAVVANNWVETTIGKGVIGKGIKKLMKWTKAYALVGLFKKQITGHSIIAYYTKTA